MKGVYIYQIIEPDCENAEHSFVMTDKPLPRWFFDYFSEIVYTEDKGQFESNVNFLVRQFNMRLFHFDDDLITKGVSSETGSMMIKLIEKIRKGAKL